MTKFIFKLFPLFLLVIFAVFINNNNIKDTVAARANCCGGGCEINERFDCDFYSCEGFVTSCKCICSCGSTVVIQGPDGIPETVVIPVDNGELKDCN